MYYKEIETERLLIRRLEDIDVEGMYLLDSDPRVQEYLGKHVVKSKEEALGVIHFIQEQYERLGIGRLAVIEKESGKFIGWTGFKYIDNGVNGVTCYLDFGYRFVYSAWGKGYATEAGRACLAFADAYLTALPLHAISEVGNSASKHVLEKLGFVTTSTFLLDNVNHFWYIRSKK